jgi:integrase
MAMPRHIEQRRLGWYAVLNVPADVQKKVGKKRFRVSLKTRDKKVAERLAKPLIADWEQQITLARDERAAKSAEAYWRIALRRATTEEERDKIIMLISDAADDIGFENVDVGQSPKRDPEAQRFFSEAVGARVPTTEYIDEWIASLQVKDKTAAMRRSTVMRLAGKFRILQDISRKDVRRWMTELMVDLKPATVQRIMSDCRIYWTYLETIEVVPEDSAPFDRLGLKVKNTARLPWSPEELMKLHRAAKAKDQVLADLILLAMYSGARLSELVDLRVADVDVDRFRIVNSKTAAGIREVPFHHKVKQTMARLIDESKDGYVLSGITAKRRAATMSKAFQRLRKAGGFSDERQVFHSIRNTVITMLERAEVPEGTVQDVVGHERSTLTGSTYSGKSTFEMRRDALEKLAY